VVATIQAAKANTTQQALRFAFISSYEDFLYLLQLREIFLNFSQATITFMYQASLGSTDAYQESTSCPSASRVLKIMIYKPTRQQVLIPLDSSTIRIIMANAALTVESCTKDLVETHSKLRVESVYKI